jgi:hypothetical protein
MEFGFEAKPWGDEWWVGQGMMPANEWSLPDEEEPKVAPSPEKDATDKAFERAFPANAKKSFLMKGFLKRQAEVEIKMFRKLKRYMFDYRASLLSLPDTMLGQLDLTVNMQQMDAKLVKMVEPIFREAISEGVNGAKEDVGEGKGIEQGVVSSGSNKFSGHKA